MRELIIENKQQYLEENYPFAEVPELADRKKCIHCEEEIIVGKYKVFVDDEGEEYICCPNAPECDGTIIDWKGV
jgi:hypothetical protein